LTASTQRLAVLGAGPKALALVAKADALRSAGYSGPEIVVIDEHDVAANWVGEHGYTDGRQPLGTPPEKDVGYPYASQWGDESGQVDQRMLGLAWQSFLARPQPGQAMTFAEWVDRGRPQPTHGQWARYLRWVAEQLQLKPENGCATELDVSDGRWTITLDDGRTRIEADGLVITGPGPAKVAYERQPIGHKRVLDGREFWQNLERLSQEHLSSVCVIGTGETAAAVTVALVNILPDDSTIEVVSTHGVVYSRGESFEENRLFSDPKGWERLTPAHRQEFVRRTDRAVFSREAKRVLDQARGVRPKAGRVLELSPYELGVYVTVAYESDSDGNAEQPPETYDLVVVAVGFDPCWFLGLMTDRVRERLDEATLADAESGLAERLELSIGADLSVEGLLPRLHVPMLAGFRQGPGFPNLSSLGRLSDRILKPYFTPPET